MANNRMYLYDPKTKSAVMLFKSTGGWYCPEGRDKILSDWIDNKDWDGAMGDDTSILLITETSELLKDADIYPTPAYLKD